MPRSWTGASALRDTRLRGERPYPSQDGADIIDVVAAPREIRDESTPLRVLVDVRQCTQLLTRHAFDVGGLIDRIIMQHLEDGSADDLAIHTSLHELLLKSPPRESLRGNLRPHERASVCRIIEQSRGCQALDGRIDVGLGFALQE